MHSDSSAASCNLLIGFNWIVDRQSVGRLLDTIGRALGDDPRPRCLVLCIASEGGFVDQAIYAYEVLRTLPVALITHNLGVVASAACVLYAAGRKRVASPGSVFLAHGSRFTPPAGANLSRDELDLSTRRAAHWDARMAEVIAEAAGREPHDVAEWFRDELFPASVAVERGLAHEILPLYRGPQDRFVQVSL